MAVDKSYGSGKPRTAANSSARRRVAAGKLTKGKPKGLTLNKVAKTAGNVVDFAFNGPKVNQGKYLEVGVSPLKLASAAKALLNSGKFRMAEAVESRLAARLEGKFQTGNINDVRMRNQSTSVFPRIDSTKIRTAPNRILEMQGRKVAGKVKPEEYTTLPTGTRVLKKDLVRSKMLNQYLGSGKTPKKRGGR